MYFKKTLLLLLALLWFCPQGWTQKKETITKATPLFVPYKVNDKFGIATENGDMVLAPQFDYITLNNTPNLFTCFTYGAQKTYQTALVVKDKIILNNQPFFGYYAYQDIVFAVKEVGGKGSGYYSFRPEEFQLFTLKGKKITEEGFSHVGTFEDFDTENKLPQVLLYLIHKDKTYSLVLYDKKTQSITTKLVDKARDMDFLNQDMIRRTKELHLKYVDTQNKGHELKIGLKGTAYVKTFEGTYVVQTSKNEYSFYDDPVAVPDWENERQPKIKVEASEIESKKLELRRDYQTYQPITLLIKSHKLDPKYQKITYENGKKGLMAARDNKVVLPSVYDDFYSADFKGIHASGYVLKQNGKYQLKVYNFSGKPSEVAGVFDLMPMITYFQYGREDFHLISLFDEQGKFVCYANQDGKVYFRN